MSTVNPLVHRLIVLVKQHKKPSSEKSTNVLIKIMEKQLLNPGNHSAKEFKQALQDALNSNVVLAEVVRQQHSEDELRGCMQNLISAIDSEGL
ncbi:hypothetical protein B9G69_001930 [Bdellovibrio sp. SKB1291214]|uniref:hypothetical protein n=1 Tax=Bdellovibrio sp. SKB1291214 TaxID=1732569 RepID=UPI000B516485|nr:hypothetical protein [Bdellovibrio sp. SKB1291214]UYL09330.1 hypothetical protein B9G69_001930 [Bdellovibrio sp. SKB1291214]